VDSLLEREGELAAVEALLDRGGGVLVVEGGAGVGKTALLEVACRRGARLGMNVLRARGSGLEADFPFGLVRQLFERRLVAGELGEREALLAGPASAVRVPDAHLEVHEVHFIDDVAVEQGTFNGTHDGVLHTPTGDIPPTGRTVSLDYIHVLRFRDGLHVAFNLMFDRLLMLEQLRLTPAPATTADQTM
jgi:SnoaL-like polyketide cyclase